MRASDRIDTSKSLIYPPQKFSVTRTRTFLGSSTIYYYMIEARDREQAKLILEEEIGPEDFLKDNEKIEWSTHETPGWRSAWRHDKVEVLHPTKIPDGIQ